MGRGTDSELVNNSSAACQLWKLRSDGGDAPHKSAHLLLIQRTPPAFVQRLVGWLAGRVARLFPVEINRDSDRGHYLTREVRASSQEPEYPGIFSPKGCCAALGRAVFPIGLCLLIRTRFWRRCLWVNKMCVREPRLGSARLKERASLCLWSLGEMNTVTWELTDGQAW